MGQVFHIETAGSSTKGDDHYAAVGIGGVGSVHHGLRVQLALLIHVRFPFQVLYVSFPFYVCRSGVIL